MITQTLYAAQSDKIPLHTQRERVGKAYVDENEHLCIESVHDQGVFTLVRFDVTETEIIFKALRQRGLQL